MWGAELYAYAYDRPARNNGTERHGKDRKAKGEARRGEARRGEAAKRAAERGVEKLGRWEERGLERIGNLVHAESPVKRTTCNSAGTCGDRATVALIHARTAHGISGGEQVFGLRGNAQARHESDHDDCCPEF